METEKMTLQTLADTKFDGDRLCALYHVIFSQEAGTLEDYSDELTSDETTFVFCAHQLRDYGVVGYINHQKKRQMQYLTQQLGFNQPGDRSAKVASFRKKMWIDLLKLLVAVLLPIPLILYFKNQTWPVEWLYSVQSVLIGLAAIDLSGSLFRLRRCKKLKRLEEELRGVQFAPRTPTFDECIQEHKNYIIEPTTAEDAVQVLNAARKRNWLGFLKLFLLWAMIMLGGGMALTHWALGIVSGICIFWYTYRQIRAMGRATFRTRDIVKGIPSDDPNYRKLNHRQSMCVLALLLLSGLYIICGGIFGAVVIALGF